MSDNNSFPMGSMIEQYKRLEAHVEVEATRFAATIKPFQDAMESINSAIKEELFKMADPAGKASFACDHGTAYLSHTLSVKVADRDKFLKHVVENDAWDMLDARAMKKPVEAWREATSDEVSADTIGLSIEPIVKCHIRKG
jgi:hypothetical protein